MTITGESLFSSAKEFTSSDSTATYYNVVTGGSSQGRIVSFINIINDDTIQNTITMTLDKYTTSYNSVFERAYLLSPGENKIPVDFMISLNGGANPDRIRAKISSSVSALKKLTVFVSGPDFT